MIYQLETLTDELLAELDPLLRLHYHEVAMYQDKIELNPDFILYKTMEEMDALRMYTWREEETEVLLGYNVFFIRAHPHYQDHVYAVNDIIYVDPEHRGADVVPFLQWCEVQLRLEDISVVTYHMKENKPFHGLMEFLSYDHAEHIYSKFIG